MVEQSDNLEDQFLNLEKECVGYDDYINCDDEHYLKTLSGLEDIVTQI